MKQIVCLSSANWYPYPTRKQQVMSRLRDCEIVYFDPPFSILAPLKDKSLRSRLFAFRHEQPHPRDNITVWSLPPILPFGSKYRFINRINQAWLSGFIRRRLKKAGFENPVIWSYLPAHCDVIKKIPHSQVVYDCVDRHSGYPGMINPEVVDGCERDLARQCDVVFSTASGLHETLSQYNEHSYMIPNGANYELFSQAQVQLDEVPPELADIKGPIIGFVGMLQECIDYDLITAAAEAHPEYTFVFVGKALPGVATDGLRSLPNVRLCGLKPQSELPRYLARFDVCINPFRAGALAKDVSPLKFYEYLATGKPIVTTPQPEQVLAFADAVEIAADAEGFIKALERSLVPDAARRKKRIAYALECTWEARVRQIEEKLGW